MGLFEDVLFGFGKDLCLFFIGLLFNQKEFGYRFIIFGRSFRFLLLNEWKLERRKVAFFLLLILCLFYLFILLDLYYFNPWIILERTNKNLFSDLRLDYLFIWSELEFISWKLLIWHYWRDRETLLLLFPKSIPIIRSIWLYLLRVSELLHHVYYSETL